jgi:hypothetical protein
MPTADELKYTRISWNRAISRCYNPKDPDYAKYGARGIIVHQLWRDSFAAFVADMGIRPKGHTLDRIRSAGHYEPGNCRWATSKVQNRHAQRLIEFHGETHSLGEWANILGIKQTTLTMRLKTLSVEEAFTKPVMS